MLHSVYAERCEASRDYIRLARAAGFRGTFIQAAEEWEKHRAELESPQIRPAIARSAGLRARLAAETHKGPGGAAGGVLGAR